MVNGTTPAICVTAIGGGRHVLLQVQQRLTLRSDFYAFEEAIPGWYERSYVAANRVVLGDPPGFSRLTRCQDEQTPCVRDCRSGDTRNTVDQGLKDAPTESDPSRVRPAAAVHVFRAIPPRTCGTPIAELVERGLALRPDTRAE